MTQKISKELLTAYVLGELPASERDKVDNLIAKYDKVRVTVKEIETTARLAQAAFQQAASSAPGLTVAQRDTVKNEAQKQPGAFLFSGDGGLFDEPDESAPSPFELGGGLFAGDGDDESQDDRTVVMTSIPSRDPLRQGKAIAPTARLGTRNDDSVLFSLKSLQVVAAASEQGQADSSSPRDDSSGLIDIRSLSMLHTGEAGGATPDNSLFESTGFSGPVAPVLAATSTQRSWVKPAIAIGGVFMIVSTVAFALFLSRRDSTLETEKQIAALQAKLEALSQTGEKDTEAVKKLETLMADLKRQEQEQKETAVAVADKADMPGSKETARPKPAKAKAWSSAKKTASIAAVPAPSETKPKPVKAKASSELDDLLGGVPSRASTSSNASRSASMSKSASGSSGNKSRLSRSDVQSGMSRVATAVKRCGQGKGGTITLTVQIGKTGRVSSASAIGAFAGTPIGSCAARAVRRAKFPASRQTLTVKYPFKL